MTIHLFGIDLNQIQPHNTPLKPAPSPIQSTSLPLKRTILFSVTATINIYNTFTAFKPSTASTFTEGKIRSPPVLDAWIFKVFQSLSTKTYTRWLQGGKYGDLSGKLR